MRTIIVAAALSVLPFGLAVGSAAAFERHTTIETGRGTYEKSVQVDCDWGHCSRQSELRGPDGGTMTREGECWRVGFRAVHCRGVLTGPEGHQIFGRGTFFIR